jgi:hypothetical protein
MKTLEKLKIETESVSFFDTNPELPSAMKSNSIINLFPEDQQSGPDSSNEDDDSSWYNESDI